MLVVCNRLTVETLESLKYEEMAELGFLFLLFPIAGSVKDPCNQFDLIKLMTDSLFADSYRRCNVEIMIERKLLLVPALNDDLYVAK